MLATRRMERLRQRPERRRHAPRQDHPGADEPTATRDVLPFLVQILLPRTGHAEARAGDFAQTRSELVERYDGVTAYLRSPAQGAWTAADGRVERDEVVMIEVVIDTFDRTWWAEYAEKLAARFRQEAIHIRALPVELP